MSTTAIIAKQILRMTRPARYSRVAALLTALVTGIGAGGALAEEQIATLRGGVPLAEEGVAAPMGNRVDEGRVERSYPMQPPLVPHAVRNYQIDQKVNKCMACHSRRLTRASQAPMVSVTHYMNRDGNFLAEVSPRRYFCLQCHVTQEPRQPLVENDFVDLQQLLGKSL